MPRRSASTVMHCQQLLQCNGTVAGIVLKAATRGVSISFCRSMVAERCSGLTGRPSWHEKNIRVMHVKSQQRPKFAGKSSGTRAHVVLKTMPDLTSLTRHLLLPVSQVAQAHPAGRVPGTTCTEVMKGGRQVISSSHRLPGCLELCLKKEILQQAFQIQSMCCTTYFG